MRVPALLLVGAALRVQRVLVVEAVREAGEEGGPAEDLWSGCVRG